MNLKRTHRKDELGKFLTNAYDPERYDSRAYYPSSLGNKSKEQSDEEWQYYVDYLEKHLIGYPVATKKCIFEELIKIHMVGIYAHPEKKEVNNG